MLRTFLKQLSSNRFKARLDEALNILVYGKASLPVAGGSELDDI